MKTYKSATKKNYIEMDGITDVMLAVNRGYGVGSYEFSLVWWLLISHICWRTM